ncbi:uncharacterized protein LOC112554728 [Pomacea canaliculata]|uniref:uncharacterized protein LOC112554728 n=1 Tax=Pomacea canaliculata TaxID=400727 RepID=UPI000D739409|nr:uncharacterized protein LOC112554728 [Pomacea canaliculata]
MTTWTQVPVLTTSEQTVWDMKQQQYSGQCLVVHHTDVHTSTSQDNNTYKQALHWTTIVCCGAIIPLLTILGLPGKVLCAVVFYKQGLRERINLCLFALAVIDIIVVIDIFIASSELLYREVIGPSWIFLPYVLGMKGSVWASHFLSAVIASERCFCVVSPFHAKRLLKTSTMAAIIVVGCTLLTAGMCAIVVPKHIPACRFDPLTNITDNIIYVTLYYLKNQTIIDIVDIFVYATALPGIFLSVIIVTTAITSSSFEQLSPGVDQ